MEHPNNALLAALPNRVVVVAALVNSSCGVAPVTPSVSVPPALASLISTKHAGAPVTPEGGKSGYGLCQAAMPPVAPTTPYCTPARLKHLYIRIMIVSAVVSAKDRDVRVMDERTPSPAVLVWLGRVFLQLASWS